MKIEVLSDGLIEVEVHTDIPVLKHRWLREPTVEEFENKLLEVQKIYMDYVSKYPGLKWLADTKLLGQRSYEEEQWLENTWERLLFEEAGVKVHAVILGDDIFADYSMEKFKSMAAKKYEQIGVKLGVFLTEENAIKWLQEN
jgi:hypothetical protein